MGNQGARNQILVVLIATIGVGVGVGIFVIFNDSWFKYLGDPKNIARRSMSIATGVSPLEFHDPPLRYIPLAGFMILFRPTGLSPLQLSAFYTLAIEFVLLPVSVAAIARNLYDDTVTVHALSILFGATLVKLSLSTFLPGWRVPLSPFIQGFWMYDYAVLPGLLAGYFATRRRPVWAGVMLAITVLIQLIIAAMAALVVATIFYLDDDIRAIGTAAATSIIAGLGPLSPFFLRYGDYFLSTGGERFFVGWRRLANGFNIYKISKLAGAVGIIIFAVLLRYYRPSWFYRMSITFDRFVKGHAPIAVLFVLTLLTLSAWYYMLAGYYLSYVAVLALGVTSAEYFRSNNSTEGLHE